jgi:exonuclease III
MIIISLNIRGVGGLLKLASLRRLMDKHRPTVIFLQETLVGAEAARNFFFALRPDWMACAASSIGTSGGLLAAWDPLHFDFTPMLSPGGILLTGTCLELNTSLTLLNAYGPCLDRKLFWENLDRLGLLAIKDLIIAGDLNLTLSSKEIWGDKAKTDPLATFFTSLFTKNALVDLEPAELLPTWRNGRAGNSGIEKRLDRFLISEDLLNPSYLARAWIDLPYIF